LPSSALDYSTTVLQHRRLAVKGNDEEEEEEVLQPEMFTATK
jgi:hypothetical protein